MTEQQKRHSFIALFTVVFTVTLGFSLVNPFFSVYAKGLTGQGLMIALVFSGFSLAKMLFTPLMGRWSDFRSRRIFILAGLVMHCLIAFFFVLLPQNLAIIIALRFLQGIATAMVRPIAQAFVGDISTENHVGSLMGSFDVSFYAALGIGPLLGGLIADRLGYRGMFLFLMLLCICALFAALFIINQDNRLPSSQARPHNRCEDVSANHTLQGLFFLIFTRSFGIAIMPIFLPLFIDSNLHCGYLGIGIGIASGSITTALLLHPFGKLADLSNRRTLVIAGGIMSGLLTLLLPLAESLGQLILLSIFLASFTTLSLPASSAILVEEGRSHGLGFTMGIFHTVMNIGFFIGPLLAGMLMDTFGLNSVFWTAGLLGIAGSTFFAFRSTPAVREDGASPEMLTISSFHEHGGSPAIKHEHDSEEIYMRTTP